MDLTLLNLDEPTETRTFERGRFELYSVGPMTIGRATYEPGWKWSEHVARRRAQARAWSSTSDTSSAGAQP